MNNNVLHRIAPSDEAFPLPSPADYAAELVHAICIGLIG
jgi:hypothetical protein